MISILILTKDEEKNLPGCIESVRWSDDIHVLDSVSRDNTQAVARKLGAIVTERPFDNWAAHQNWALANIPFKHMWVFYLDADERCTPSLKDALLQAVAAPGENVAYRIQRRDFFLGTWLKHVQTSPFYMRLFRPECMKYERLVNPVSIPSGPIAQLTGYLDHFPFSKGIGHWIERHNQYSRFEAEQIVANRRAQGEERPKVSIRSALFEKDFHKRRFHQKELFYKTPGRPLIKFLVLYLLKKGFLDGRAGFTYATLQAIYEYLIVLKTREIEYMGQL